jgi:uncharacterized membrane protein YagU involved in acid resistance
MSDVPNRVLSGSLAGFAATAPMTAVMEALYRVLPPHERRGPLPPREITMKAAEAVDAENELSETQKKGLTGLAHFAYGAGAGAGYGAVSPHLPFGPAANGVAYGLAVWAGSYLGWLPAAGVLPPATAEPAGKNAVMIIAHVVWGAALGVLTDRLVGGRPGSSRCFRRPAGPGG